MILEATNLKPLTENISKLKVSGLLDSHYAPKAKVILDQSPSAGDGFIALSDVITPEGVIRLASPKNNVEYAKTLYSALRQADAQGLSRVVIISAKGDDLAVAINDRLAKAAY